MTIVEALRESRATGKAYERGTCTPTSFGGWLKWDDAWEYKLSADDLVADDWQEV